MSSMQMAFSIVLALGLIMMSILALVYLIMTDRQRENIIMSLDASGEWVDHPRSTKKRPRMWLAIGFLTLSVLVILVVTLVNDFEWLNALIISLVGTVLLIHTYYLSLAHVHPIECSGRRTSLPYEEVVETVEGVLLEKRMDFSAYDSGGYRSGPILRELRRIQRYLEVGDPDGRFYDLDDRFLQVRDLSSEQGIRVHVKLFYDGTKDGPWRDLMKEEIDRHLDGIPAEQKDRG